ncbi:MAG: MFS transporter [Burkholderiaceae bacterium]|jgi:UMF1 family MFS transporter|nr:MFS transporter [Burkholderiaceae bacterium]
MPLFDPKSLQPGVPRKEVFAWAMYDFANSGYTTVVLTAVFNAYFVGVVAQGAPWATLAWTLLLSASYVIGMLVMPALGAYADVHARKKRLLGIVTAICVVATALLALVGEGDLWLAAPLIIVSNLCFAAGVTFNSAFLPELARPEALGKVSGWGWSIGYLGGLLALALCLAWVLSAQGRGEPATSYVPVTMLITAALYAVASIPAFTVLRERAQPQSNATVASLVRESTARLWLTLRHIHDYRDFGWLMLCGLLYQAGLSVVVALAAIYAQEVMKFSTPQTMMLILVVNVTAAIGAFGFGYVQDRIGHKRALALTIAGWIAMIAIAAGSTGTAGFWLAANIAGLCMGSSQSAGRAMVGVFAPTHRLAEFYGLWNAAVWLSAIVGPVTYGLVTWLTDNDHRLAMMITGVYFVAGLVVLAKVNVERGRAAARATQD